MPAALAMAGVPSKYFLVKLAAMPYSRVAVRHASTAKPDIGSAPLNEALSHAKAATPTKPITRPTTREPLGLSPSQAQATSAPPQQQGQ